MNTPDRLTGSDISSLLNRHGMEVVTNRVIWSPLTPSREYTAAPLGGRVITLEELGKIIEGVNGPWIVEKWMPRFWKGSMQMGQLRIWGCSEGAIEPASIILYPDFNYARVAGYYLRGISEGFVKPDHRFNCLETHEIRIEDIMRIESGEVPLPELAAYLKSEGTWITRLPETEIVELVGIGS